MYIVNEDKIGVSLVSFFNFLLKLLLFSEGDQLPEQVDEEEEEGMDEDGVDALTLSSSSKTGGVYLLTTVFFKLNRKYVSIFHFFRLYHLLSCAYFIVITILEAISRHYHYQSYYLL
jgi:hypothetical protein